MTAPNWAWQQPSWPHFTWNAASLDKLLYDCQQMQGQLVDAASSMTREAQTKFALDTLLSNIVTTSAIEGERLDVSSMRSSLVRRLGRC